ncbi:hypothetical protein ANO14919_114040 [Xylariales sp. No.14919]|nr:hypothetical protein ANO14919_114040 [Xylariales sp. No.14919]
MADFCRSSHGREQTVGNNGQAQPWVSVLWDGMKDEDEDELPRFGAWCGYRIVDSESERRQTRRSSTLEATQKTTPRYYSLPYGTVRDSSMGDSIVFGGGSGGGGDVIVTGKPTRLKLQTTLLTLD